MDNDIFKRFGRINKGACKRAKVAPDSVMQVLFQIAFRKVNTKKLGVANLSMCL